MKCSGEDLRCRYEYTKDIDIYELIANDKEAYEEESKKFSSLEELFTSLLKLTKHNDEEHRKYVKIDDSLDIVISFLKSNYKDMYYRFMGVLSNKRIHFISRSDLPEIIAYFLDYIYNIVINATFTSCDMFEKLSDIIYDNLCDSTLNEYLTFLSFLGFDINDIVANCGFVSDYELSKKNFIDSIMDSNISSYAAGNEIFICYDNTFKDAFDILHEFIHVDNLCPSNVVHYDENINFGDFVSNRPHNFFFNEIPSIMMEEELYDYLVSNFDYDLSFYFSYRMIFIQDEIESIYLPLMNSDKDRMIYDEYLNTVRSFLISSQNCSLMYMLTHEHDNSDNKQLSYIFGIIISRYAMTLSKEERDSIFNYVRSRITSDEDYFTMFKNIGLDILDSKGINKLLSSLYERNRVMKNSLVKKR